MLLTVVQAELVLMEAIKENMTETRHKRYDQEIALVIVGTNPHAELVQKLKKRGYYVLLVDYADNPPAKQFADEHYQVNVFDAEAILEIARKRKPDLVISSAAERANAVACYVSEKMGLYVPYSYEKAMEISHKVSMKKKMQEFGIPTSKHIHTNDLSSIDLKDLDFPLVIKPADGYGSKGICKFYNEEELIAGLKDNPYFTDSKYMIIEEFLDGREFGLYCHVGEGKADLVFINEKIKNRNIDSLPAYGTISNPDLDDKTIGGFLEIANMIVDKFELNNTPLLIQLVITDNGIKVLEFSPRLGGGVSYRTVKLQTGFDFLEFSIHSFLGIPYSQEYKNGKYRILDSGIYVKHGFFGKIEGEEELIKKGVIEELILYKTRGMEIGKDFSSSSRVGAFIIKARDNNELYKKIVTAYNRLKVYDVNGHEIILNDFHMKRDEIN